MIIIVLLLICIGSQVESDSPYYHISPSQYGSIFAKQPNTRITYGYDDGPFCSPAEKFESAKEDSKEKIEKPLKPDEEITRSGPVPVIPNTSHLTEHSKASMSTNTLFDLDELISMMSGKKEDVSPSVPKPCPGLRSSKNEVVDLGPGIEGMEWVLKGVAKLMEERKIIHTEVQELRNANLDAYTKCAAIDKELQVAKKLNKEMESLHEIKMAEMVENAKRSAIIAILTAKIQMASQAGEKGKELWGDEMDTWAVTLKSMKCDT